MDVWRKKLIKLDFFSIEFIYTFVWVCFWSGRNNSSSELRRSPRLDLDVDERNFNKASSCLRFFIFLLDCRGGLEDIPASRSFIRSSIKWELLWSDRLTGNLIVVGIIKLKNQ